MRLHVCEYLICIKLIQILACIRLIQPGGDSLGLS